MIPTLLGVVVLVFVLLRVIPGDVVEMRFASGQNQFVDQKVLAAERAKLGLDKPILLQFVDYLWGLARFDLGRSMWTGSPITEEIKLRLALSLQLALMATLVATLLAIPLGIVAALRQDTWIDYAVRIFSIAGLAMPSFWLGILLILFLLVTFRWLPPMVYTPFWVDPWQNLAQLIWPAHGGRLPLLGGRDPDDALGDARGPARGLHPDGASQGAVAEPDPDAPRAQERAAPRADGHRAGVRVPARRPRRDRAGVQPERDRPPVREGDRAPGLHADPGAGPPGGDDVHLS